MVLLFDELARWRGRVAKELGKPAYVVIDNKTLQAVAKARPSNLAALGRIKGVGPKRLADYGEAMLAIVGGNGGPAASGGPAGSRGGAPAGTSSAAAAAASLFGSASRRPPISNASDATASASASATTAASHVSMTVPKEGPPAKGESRGMGRTSALHQSAGVFSALDRKRIALDLAALACRKQETAAMIAHIDGVFNMLEEQQRRADERRDRKWTELMAREERHWEERLAAQARENARAERKAKRDTEALFAMLMVELLW